MLLSGNGILGVYIITIVSHNIVLFSESSSHAHYNKSQDRRNHIPINTTVNQNVIIHNVSYKIIYIIDNIVIRTIACIIDDKKNKKTVSSL